jgi:general secretion pathway protein B
VPPTAPPATDAAVARLYQGAAKPASAGSASPPTARTVAATRPQVRQDVPVPVSQSEEVAEQPVDIAEILSRAEQELGRPPLAEHPAPFLANLSQQTKDAIPTLMYKRHDYAGAGGSSVMINGKTIGTGASVAPGVRVDEILPSSVILSHQGTQFRLRALNSWINL